MHIRPSPELGTYRQLVLPLPEADAVVVAVLARWVVLREVKATDPERRQQREGRVGDPGQARQLHPRIASVAWGAAGQRRRLHRI